MRDSVCRLGCRCAGGRKDRLEEQTSRALAKSVSINQLEMRVEEGIEVAFSP